MCSAAMPALPRLRALSRELALPTASGVLYFLSWVGFGLWPLAFVCFVPLLLSLRGATAKQALRRGWWMGFVTHLGGYAWVIHMLRVFAYLPLPLAVLGYLLLCAAQGLLFGVLAAAVSQAGLRCRWPLAALLPVALCAVEWAYPLLFQSYTGVALAPLLPLVQVADLGGVLLLSALQAVVNGAAADAVLRRGPRGGISASPVAPLAASAVCLALAVAYGLPRLWQMSRRQAAAPHLSIGIAQPDVGEQQLHDDPLSSVHALWNETLELHGRGAELVVWPETGFNARPIDLSHPLPGRAIQGGVPVPLIAGVVRVHGRDQIWNSALAISADGELGDHYDKIKLLAFGEYIPLGDYFPALYRWSPESSHLSVGATTAPLRAAGYRFATIICYEDILPGLVRAVMADHGEGRAHALVNLTNDSWYGDGHEQEQHLVLASLRAVEHRRWLVRATSTGISAFVDATGAIVQRIPRGVAGVAVRDVPMLQGTTPYEVLGDWPGYLSALLLLGIFGRDLARARLRR